jgi:peptidoglycan-associated lipoprotein
MPPTVAVVDRRPDRKVPATVPEPVVPPAPVDPEAAIRTLNESLADAYFPYDRAEPLPEGLAVLRNDAELLRDKAGIVIVVEGHCDDRGSAEYNLGLGDRRARRAAEILQENGVPFAMMQILSYGKEMPQCTDTSESCRQRNRRAHLSVRPAPGPASDESASGGVARPDQSRPW